MIKKIYDYFVHSSEFYYSNLEPKKVLKALKSKGVKITPVHDTVDFSELYYFLEPQNVMLKHVQYEPKKSSKTEKAEVTLFGPEKGMGEIEKILLEAKK